MLVKYNRKTVTVLTEDGRKWNVSPHLLKSAEQDANVAVKIDGVIEVEK